MDRNGYNPNLFGSEDGKCWLCGNITDTNRHELFRGTNRANSKKYGLWIALCPRCHRLAHKHEYEEELHRIGEVMFCTVDGNTREKFREIFGKEYVE